MGFWGKFLRKDTENTGEKQEALQINEEQVSQPSQDDTENQKSESIPEIENILETNHAVKEETDEDDSVKETGGFWGRLFKKDNKEAVQNEEILKDEASESEIDKTVQEAEKEEMPQAVEETMPEQPETTPEKIAGEEPPLEEKTEVTENIEEKAEEQLSETTVEEESGKEEGGFWGRLFKKENKEAVQNEEILKDEASETEIDKAVQEAEKEEMPQAVEEIMPEQPETAPEKIAGEETQLEEKIEVTENIEEKAEEQLSETEDEEETGKEEGGFWGRLFKKENKEAVQNEEILKDEVSEPEIDKAVQEAEKEEMPQAVEETMPEQPETAPEKIAGEEPPLEEKTEVTESIEEKAEEQPSETEDEEETGKEEGGFWGRLFKKENGGESSEKEENYSQEGIEHEKVQEVQAEDKAQNQEEKPPMRSFEEIAAAVVRETKEAEAAAAAEAALNGETSAGMFGRLKQGLTQTRNSISGKIEGLLRRTPVIDDDFYDELEDILMQADVGVETTMKLVDNIRKSVHKKKIKEADQVFDVIKEEIRAILGEEKVDMESVDVRPAVILVVGVNGAGKTTSIAKMTWRFKQGGSRVILAAADTFRAAAIDQLQIWADRIGVPLVKHEEGSDPGAVVFDAVQEAKKGKYDILIVDTAGRLQNKSNLMNEIAKLKKIISREIEGAPHEVLLVLDATTGQNALNQAKQFSEVTGVTGIVLTKLDGTAKGGVVIAIASELNIPVKLIGIGEGMEDLREFSAQDFADALFAVDENVKPDDETEEGQDEDTY